MKDVSYVSHYLDTATLLGQKLAPTESVYELFSPRNSQNKTRWMIFKVKERGKSSLEEVRRLSLDPRLSNIEKFDYVKESQTSKTTETENVENIFQRGSGRVSKLQFNWPYDYFSFVELIKLESKIDSYNYTRLVDEEEE